MHPMTKYFYVIVRSDGVRLPFKYYLRVDAEAVCNRLNSENNDFTFKIVKLSN